MPTLDWIGKKAVLNHHREVPFRLLKCDKSISISEADTEILPIQDNKLTFVDQYHVCGWQTESNIYVSAPISD